MLLQDKRIIVTGGASGIGAGTVRGYVRDGARVVSLDVSDADGARVVAEAGGHATFMHCDIADRHQVFEMFERAVKLLGGLDVMATIWNVDQVSEALALAGELRSVGLRVEVYPEADKLGKQMKYASTRGARFVTIEGDDERTRGEVTVKNLTTGEQTAVPRSSVAAWITARRSSPSS